MISDINNEIKTKNNIATIILGQADVIIECRNIMREMEKNVVGTESNKEKNATLQREVQVLSDENKTLQDQMESLKEEHIERMKKMEKEADQTKAELMATIKKLNWCHHRNKTLEKDLSNIKRSNQIWKYMCNS